MATTVIIPARNEEVRIGPIVRVFSEHPDTKDRVFVGIDRQTVDSTPYQARTAGGIPILTGVHGKGEVVYRTLLAVSILPGVLTERVILCDGDYHGLTVEHVDKILAPIADMMIGVPDWPETDIPEHVIMAWPMVSGFRCLPWGLIPSNAHGYLIETQINAKAIRHRLSVSHVFMEGLKSPFQWPLAGRREAARIADREWGKTHGVL